jgi:hypothetical protein
MLHKQGIKGTLEDGPITEHPQFGRIQWNQSYSHMPRGHRARAADEPEMMDIEEQAAPEPVEPVAKPHVADDEEEEEEEEGEARGNDHPQTCRFLCLTRYLGGHPILDFRYTERCTPG